MGLAWAFSSRWGKRSTVRKNNIVWHPTVSGLALCQPQTLPGCSVLAMMTLLPSSIGVMGPIPQPSHVTEVPVPGCKGKTFLEVSLISESLAVLPCV